MNVKNLENTTAMKGQNIEMFNKILERMDSILDRMDSINDRVADLERHNRS